MKLSSILLKKDKKRYFLVDCIVCYKAIGLLENLLGENSAIHAVSPERHTKVEEWAPKSKWVPGAEE